MSSCGSYADATSMQKLHRLLNDFYIHKESLILYAEYFFKPTHIDDNDQYE